MTLLHLPPSPNIVCLLRRTVFAMLLAAASLSLGPAGCANLQPSPYATATEASRNPLEAQRLTLKAVALLDESAANTSEAQQLLTSALTADLYHGPAHNNLGVIYLKQGKLYEAASEFEWARKLMPGLPEPRTNLAMTLERAGRTDEALSTYRTALSVYSDHIQTMQAIARLQIRSGKTDEETPRYLSEIALRGSSDRWREWAKGQVERISGKQKS